MSFSTDNLTTHEVKQLKKKKHVDPHFLANDPEDVYATSEDEDFEMEPVAKPSWVAKLTDRKSTRLNSSHKTESRMPSSA